MPIINASTFRKPFWLFNRHLETIVPSLFRSVSRCINPIRVRISTPDDDFLDCDWYKSNGKTAVIISHGLEGDSERPYVLGMVNQFHKENFDVFAWNFRSCSGEMNLTKRFYHSGATYDLDEVVSHVIRLGFERIALVGFSLGGNLTLKYLGEGARPDQVKTGVAISVPLDLAGCSAELEKRHNVLYEKRFLASLRVKMKLKTAAMPELSEIFDIHQIKTIYQFDDQVTGPLHGFDSADHYYKESSSKFYVADIAVPTLVINAVNDPFLSESCFDQTIFESSEQVYFEMPKFGGHVGFKQKNSGEIYWSEIRAHEFISQHI